MAAFTKVNDFVEHLAEGVHNLASNQLAVALSNTAPASESSNPTADGNGVLGNVTEISYTDCSSRNITLTSSAQTAGTYKLTLTDLTLTSSGTVGPFQYVYIYNTAGTGQTNPLIGVYDYGSSITLNNTETLDIDFDDSNGVLTLA
jgi:hypothetical protein